MTNETLIKLWSESWASGIWVAPWEKAVAGLTPHMAAWRPAPDRHSIWEIVNHVCIWREYTLSKIDPSRPGPKREEMEHRNFEPARAINELDWDATVARLRETHVAIEGAMKAMVNEVAQERLPHHLGHDCYHLGQIMYVRAMLGMKPIE